MYVSVCILWYNAAIRLGIATRKPVLAGCRILSPSDITKGCPMPELLCAYAPCGKIFSAVPHRIRAGRRYCSHSCASAAKCLSDSDRFWRHVQRCAHVWPCSQCCWLWQGGKDRQGYGLYHPKTNRQYKNRHSGAHRQSWELTFGPIPLGLFVLHDCPSGDNPACVNHLHLFVGTQQDNMKDAMRKGRIPL